MFSIFSPSALSGEVRLGIPGKEIIVKAAGGMDMAIDNHFYGEINKLSVGACSEAFGYNLKLPQVILDSGFPEGLTIGFSSNPKGRIKIFLKLFYKNFFKFLCQYCYKY